MKDREFIIALSSHAICKDDSLRVVERRVPELIRRQRGQ